MDSTKEMLVIGNGFDLQCELDTRYEDFFYDRYFIDPSSDENIAKFKEIFRNKIDQLKLDKTKIGNSNGWVINSFYDGFADFLKEDKSEIRKRIGLTNWDVVFIATFVLMDNDKQKDWCDIESIIGKIVTVIFEDNEDADINKIFPEEDFSYNGKDSEKLYNLIKYNFSESKRTSSDALLTGLKNFEATFAGYIRDQITSKGDYLTNASNLLTQITGSSLNNPVDVDVINFNYSLDENLVEQLKQNLPSNIDINNWTNIHGIAFWNDQDTATVINRKHTEGRRTKLMRPVFGIDNHDALADMHNKSLKNNDARIMFTKTFRLLDGHINNMRDKNHQFQKKVDKIIFYGHSLNHADYSYFETLFDKYNIYDSNVELDFYYTSSEQEQEDRNSERETLKNIIKLLSYYGETLPNVHGENLANKLVLEQRINLIPSPPKPKK